MGKYAIQATWETESDNMLQIEHIITLSRYGSRQVWLIRPFGKLPLPLHRSDARRGFQSARVLKTSKYDQGCAFLGKRGYCPAQASQDPGADPPSTKYRG